MVIIFMQSSDYLADIVFNIWVVKDCKLLAVIYNVSD